MFQGVVNQLALVIYLMFVLFCFLHHFSWTCDLGLVRITNVSLMFMDHFLTFLVGYSFCFSLCLFSTFNVHSRARTSLKRVVFVTQYNKFKPKQVKSNYRTAFCRACRHALKNDWSKTFGKPGFLFLHYVLQVKGKVLLYSASLLSAFTLCAFVLWASSTLHKNGEPGSKQYILLIILPFHEEAHKEQGPQN